MRLPKHVEIKKTDLKLPGEEKQKASEDDNKEKARWFEKNSKYEVYCVIIFFFWGVPESKF